MRFFSFFKRNKMVRATDSTVLELFCDPLPCVRIGMVGLGRRGVSTLRRYAAVSGALFTALADLRAESLKVALENSVHQIWLRMKVRMPGGIFVGIAMSMWFISVLIGRRMPK